MNQINETAIAVPSSFRTGESLRESPIALSVERAGELIGVGMTEIYARIASGELPSVKLGKRRLVLRADLEALLQANLVPA